jgi:two-component system, OmpR family, sensor kinase
MSRASGRRPLFWKLLVGSWLTLILMTIGNALVFQLAASAAIPWGIEAITRFERGQLSIAAKILEQQGLHAVQQFASYLPPGERLEVTADANVGREAATSDLTLSQLVHTPDTVYRLTYTTSSRNFFPSEPARLKHISLDLMFVDFVSVTIFTILFARYLARPVKILRGGLERVAGGDLTVRVAALLAHRRDEMAELADHFDRMAERLQQLLQARERLLHDVSHELRSPLTRLQLAVDLARQQEDRTVESLDRIEHEAQRLSDLVEELMSRSRAEFNAAQSDAYFEIVELVGAVVADAKFEAQAKGVEVVYEIPRGLDAGSGPVINGSPELMRKGVDNVVRNALKVSAAGQQVTVRLEAVGTPVERLRILVSDQGTGVPEQDIQRIFEPFVRLENAAYGGGAGLGLAIARSAAAAHKGSVTASNRAGGGLTVVFDLPVYQSINGDTEALSS